MVLDSENPGITDPEYLPNYTTDFQEAIWYGRIKQYLNHKEMIENSIIHIFSIILGQCEIPLKEKL